MTSAYLTHLTLSQSVAMRARARARTPARVSGFDGLVTRGGFFAELSFSSSLPPSLFPVCSGATHLCAFSLPVMSLLFVSAISQIDYFTPKKPRDYFKPTAEARGGRGGGVAHISTVPFNLANILLFFFYFFLVAQCSRNINGLFSTLLVTET